MMVSILFATVLHLSGIEPVAAVLPVTRRPDVPGWDVAALRAEAAGEALLRAHGYTIYDSRKLGRFEPKDDAAATELLRRTVSGGKIDVALAVSILDCTLNGAVREPISPVGPIWPTKRPIPFEDKSKPEAGSGAGKHSTAMNEVSLKLKVWLLESGEARPFIDGKEPRTATAGACDLDRLAGEAAQRCMEDVLRRFIRLRAPIGWD